MQEDRHHPSVDESLPRRLNRLNRVSAVSFFFGGSLFALGAFFAQVGSQTLKTVNVTYLVGGLFFSLGGAVLVRLVDLTIMSGPDPERTWASRAHQSGWLGAVVLFGGTLLFGLSLVAAFAQGLTPRQSDGWIWLPDILGCVCFLVSGRLALRDLRLRPWRVRVDTLDWWVAGINQIGSVLFFLAGLAAFTRPATSSAINIGMVNWGTFAGAACFAIGGVLQVFDDPAREKEQPVEADERAI